MWPEFCRNILQKGGICGLLLIVKRVVRGRWIDVYDVLTATVANSIINDAGRLTMLKGLVCGRRIHVGAFIVATKNCVVNDAINAVVRGLAVPGHPYTGPMIDNVVIFFSVVAGNPRNNIDFVRCPLWLSVHQNIVKRAVLFTVNP